MAARHATQRILTILLGALLLGGAVLPAGGDSDKTAPAPLSELLERAIFAEETLGDLDRAIEIYEQILGQGRDERPYIAQAQLRLGMCYLKQGRKEDAVSALRNLVEEFPNQSELVAEAWNRLTELGHTPPGPAGAVVRKLWEGGSEYSLAGSASPDGRFLTLRSGGELSVLDLDSGGIRQLTTNDGTGFGAWHSAVSPDGRRIAYGWWQQEGSGLRVVGLEGAPVTVLAAQGRTDLRPLGWLPDGKHVAARWEIGDHATVVAVVGVEDGSVRTLETFEDESPGAMSLSPDGGHIAFDLPAGAERPERDLYLVATSGGPRIPLVTGAGSNARPQWTPDGRAVVFLSDRGGSIGVWWVEVVGGEPRGEPVVLKPDIGLVAPLGMDRSGSYYYGALSPERNIFEVALDPATGRASGEPKVAIERFVGRNVSPQWSPAGGLLAYLSERSLGADWLDTVVVRDANGGGEREFSPNLAYVGEAYRPAWSPDGRFVVVTGADRNRRQGFYGIDARTGETRPIVQAAFGDFLENATFSADGKTIYYDHDETAAHPSLAVSRDLDTGEETVLASVSDPLSVEVMGLSPDGRQLALRFRDAEKRWTSLALVPAAGGELRELLRLQAPRAIHGGGNLVWSADGRDLIFVVGDSSEGGSDEIWRMAAAGGEASSIGVSRKEIWGLSLHPDGNRLTFSAGESPAEIWVMENFLPPSVASR